MPHRPTSQAWPSNRAVLLVHGVGNAKPGDYAALVAHLQAALGTSAGEFAIYELYYNAVNNWFKEKTALSDKLQQARAILKVGVSDPDLAHAVAEYVGDVLSAVVQPLGTRGGSRGVPRPTQAGRARRRRFGRLAREPAHQHRCA